MAECLGVLFAVGMVFFVAYFAIRGELGTSYAQRSLRAIAERFRGRYIGGGLLGVSRTEFWNDGSIQCQYVPRGGRTYLQLVLASTRVAVSGKIATLPRVGAPVPAEPGYASFTRFRDGQGQEWVLYHQDATDGYRLLQDGFRQQLGVLRHSPFTSAVELDLGPQGLIVRKLWSSIVPDNAVRYASQVVSLRDQLTLIDTGDIQFVEELAPTAIGPSVCRVCGETIEEAAVMCSRCRTPHHIDCWQYNQGCSVYGCGCKERVPVLRAG